MKIRKLNDIYGILTSRAEKKRLVAAYAVDAHSLEAIHRAVDEGMIDATIIGDELKIRQVCEEHGFDSSCFEIIDEADDVKSAEKAVAMIRDGRGDMLMKGLLSTDKYMHAILHKEKGIVNKKVLSHVTVIDSPGYHKLMVVSDVAVIPLPDMQQKMAIIGYVVEVAHKLGIETPKVALLAPSEQVLLKIPSSTEAAILSKMNERRQLRPDAVIEGPLALDVAIDREAAQVKGITSPVSGEADCLVFPNIETGNVFYKTSTKLGGAEVGGVLMGAKVPCVLSSRGDSILSKLNSIALAAILS